MTEHWLPAEGYEGFYEVSNQGRVRAIARRRGSPRAVLAGGIDSPGYPMVSLRRPGGNLRKARIHRLVTAAFIGPCPDGMEVRHLDGDKLNGTLANLAYGTREENRRDMVGHGTHNEARKTHCPRGHPYDEANTYRRPSGRRDCRSCNRLRRRAVTEQDASETPEVTDG